MVWMRLGNKKRKWEVLKRKRNLRGKKKEDSEELDMEKEEDKIEIAKNSKVRRERKE